MEKPRQSYTLEFKLKAVALSITHCSAIRVARKLGTTVENIRRWKNQLANERPGNRTKQTTETTHLQLKRLKREIVEVKMERDIRRKAASILSSETRVKFELIKH